jgi:hypothetical protein
VVTEALESRRLLSGGVLVAAGTPSDPVAVPWVLRSRNGREGVPSAGAAVGWTGGGPDASLLRASIEGINFETEGALNGSPGFGTIPPDAYGAAGPSHVVSVVNSAIQFHTKSGMLTYSEDLFQFFAFQPLSGTFDPRVAFDQHSGRWVVVALDQTDTAAGQPSNTSRIYIATSDDADPNGAWTVRSIDSKLNISGLDRWVDFAGLAVDEEAIYVTGNMASFGGAPAVGGSRLWIVDKAALYGSGTLSFTVHNPLGVAGLSPGVAVTLQPAHVYGSAPAGLGTYLVNTAGWQDGASNDFAAVIQVNNPLTAPTFTNTFVSYGGNVDNTGMAFPGAPQSGTSVTIRTNDRRVSSAPVWRDNSLYFSSTIIPNAGPDAGQPTVRWNRVSADGATVAPVDGGNVGGEQFGANTATFFPGIAVDAEGNMAVSFSYSNGTIFPSAGFALRLASDPSGTTRPPGTLAAGQDFYVRTYSLPANQSALNRWGNYSQVSVDPSDDSFWAFNQYARTRGSAFQSEEGRWGTRWGNFVAGASPSAPSQPDLAPSSDNGPSDSDNVTNDNTPTFTGTAEPNSTVRLFAGPSEVGSVAASATGEWSITASALTDGTYAFTATAGNAFGIGPASIPLSVTIDTVPPQLLSAFFSFQDTHSVTYAFSESVAEAFSTADVTVTNLTTSAVVATGSLLLGYDPQIDVATLTFPGVAGPPTGILADGNYSTVLSPQGVTDLAGNGLTGTPTFPFFVLAGDANRDRSVDIGDFSILAANFNASPRVFGQGDFNYSGTVDIGDFAILASRFNTSLPAQGAPPRASTAIGPRAGGWRALPSEERALTGIFASDSVCVL